VEGCRTAHRGIFVLRGWHGHTGHKIAINPAALHVEVTLTAEAAVSDRPLLLDETGLRTRYYLPREDVRMDLLAQRPAATCPFKGRASYWSLQTNGSIHEDLVLGYETPIPRQPRSLA
jgi:uncharacterized protein (DUF427 family)